jgi:hypothetical protein
MEGEQKVENQIRTFDVKIEAKALNKISKLLREASNLFSEEEILKMEDVFALDRMYIFAIIAKTTEAKLFLRRFVDKKEYDVSKVKALKSLSYFCSDEVIGSYDAKILMKLIDFLAIFDSVVKIKVKKCFPAWIENEHFVIVLAPRIREE